MYSKGECNEFYFKINYNKHMKHIWVSNMFHGMMETCFLVFPLPNARFHNLIYTIKLKFGFSPQMGNYASKYIPLITVGTMYSTIIRFGYLSRTYASTVSLPEGPCTRNSFPPIWKVYQDSSSSPNDIGTTYSLAASAALMIAFPIFPVHSSTWTE